MREFKSLLVASLVAVLLAGCGGNVPSPSSSFATSSIYPSMKAVQDESGNVITTVQLRSGTAPNASYLYLSGEDVLYTSLDAPPQQFMSFNGSLFGNSLELSKRLIVMAVRDLYIDNTLFYQIVMGRPEYYSNDTPSSGTLPVRAYVDLERTGHAMTGPSSIDLPGAFQISAPASEASITRATPVVLTWTNTDATTTMEIDVGVVCDDGSQNSWSSSFGADTGSATLNSASYLPAAASPASNCRVAYKLQRVRTGGISTQFAMGSFKGVQQRTVQFITTP